MLVHFFVKKGSGKRQHKIIDNSKAAVVSTRRSKWARWSRNRKWRDVIGYVFFAPFQPFSACCKNTMTSLLGLVFCHFSTLFITLSLSFFLSVGLFNSAQYTTEINPQKPINNSNILNYCQLKVICECFAFTWQMSNVPVSPLLIQYQHVFKMKI